MAITQRYQPATRGQSAHTVRLDNPTDHLSTIISAISTTISRHSRSALRTNMGTDHYLYYYLQKGFGVEVGRKEAVASGDIWVLPYEHYLIVDA